MSEWMVLQQDRVPAYITWERYVANQQQLLQNGPGRVLPGCPARQGAADESAGLRGLWPAHVCQLSEQIDRLLETVATLPGELDLLPIAEALKSARSRTRGKPNVIARGPEPVSPGISRVRRRMGSVALLQSRLLWVYAADKRGIECCGLETGAVDDLVVQQVLRALEPATLKLSLRAIEDIHQGAPDVFTATGSNAWSGPPTRPNAPNGSTRRSSRRIVSWRSLERQWEEALRNQRELMEEYDRFSKEQPPHLTEDQRARILALSSDLPTLWNAPETTAADRKEIIRLVVDRVVVHVRADSECGEAVIWWRDGVTTRHEIVRPVSRTNRWAITIS